MPCYEFFWDDETLDHIAQHDVSREEFEYCVQHPIISAKAAPPAGPVVGAHLTTDDGCSACMR